MGYSWSVVTHLGTRLLVPSGGVLFEPMDASKQEAVVQF